jgi:hypothetical protein
MLRYLILTQCHQCHHLSWKLLQSRLRTQLFVALASKTLFVSPKARTPLCSATPPRTTCTPPCPPSPASTDPFPNPPALPQSHEAQHMVGRGAPPDLAHHRPASHSAASPTNTCPPSTPTAPPTCTAPPRHLPFPLPCTTPTAAS